MVQSTVDASVVPGLFGASEQAAFQQFIEKERQRAIEKHGRLGALHVDVTGLYQAWSAGRIYEKFEVPKLLP